jgi:hypothetical protein
MQVTLTQLRSHLYEWMDQLIETGESIELSRKGVKIKISVDTPAVPKSRKFTQRKNVINGKPEDIVSTHWISEWDDKNALP